MENICESIIHLITVDYGDAQIRDISDGLHTLLKRFLDDSDLSCADIEIKKCGSMEEKTRVIIDGIEFDFLVKLPLSKFCDLGNISFIHSCPGSIQIQCKDVFLKTNEIKEEFNGRIMNVVKQNCERMRCDSGSGCSYCSVNLESGRLRVKPNDKSELKFQWLPKSGNNVACLRCRVEGDEIIRYHTSEDIEKKQIKSELTPFMQGIMLDSISGKLGEEIQVDFHPIFQIEHSKCKPHDSPQEVLKQENSYFLFPKSPKRHDKNDTERYGNNCKGDTSCWRISCYDKELPKLRDAKKHHKHAFMMLKFIYSQIKERMKGCLTSYDIKTAVLFHTEACEQKLMPLDEASSTEHSVSSCVSAILTWLADRFDEANVPSFVLNMNLIQQNLNIVGADVESNGDIARTTCKQVSHVLETVNKSFKENMHRDYREFVKYLQFIKYSLTETNSRLYTDIEKFKIEFDKHLQKNIQDKKSDKTVLIKKIKMKLKKDKLDEIHTEMAKRRLANYLE